MCGIAGILSEQGISCSPMLAAMSHRGPAKQHETAYRGLSFGYRRLPVIDLVTGDQPFSTSDGNVTVYYNGEIYNHLELRKELEQSAVFRTESDGEILAAGFQQWKTGLFNRLNGDFSIAILDRAQDCLFLCRDRLGIKPLYYSHHKDFLFGSEIRSLLASDRCHTRLRDSAISEYLSFLFPLYPESFFQGILSVRPGTFLQINLNTGKSEEKVYWTPEIRTEENISFPEAVEEFKRLFQSSVQLRLMSDVPLGSFLSGGLDSTAICLNAGNTVSHYFTSHFPEYPDYSELCSASAVSSIFSGKHHALEISASEIVRIFSDCVWSHESPPSGAASYFLYLISEKASEHVRVILDGNGGDEILAGYPRYHMMLENDPRFFDDKQYLEKIRRLTPQLPYIESVSDNTEEIYQRIIRILGKPELPHFCISSEDPGKKFADRYQKHEITLKSLLQTDIVSYLISLLEVQDKLTMAFSLENRVPFLDHRIVEFCLSLPDSFLKNHNSGKLLLRSAFSELYPEKLKNLPKAGTPRPDVEWFRNGILSEFMKDKLQNPGSPLFNYLYFSPVNSLVTSHLQNKGTFSQRIWALLGLNQFLEVYSRWI